MNYQVTEEMEKTHAMKYAEWKKSLGQLLRAIGPYGWMEKQFIREHKNKKQGISWYINVVWLREHARGRQGGGLARAGSAHALPGGGDRINRCISALPAHHDGVSVPSASPRARCSHHRDVGVCAALPVSELRSNL